MSRLLAVDPGIRGSGAAYFQDGLLVSAEYVKNPCRDGNRAAEASTMAHAIFDWCDLATELALEWPRVYASMIAAGRSPGDPNDLLALAAVSASVAALCLSARATTYVPSEWKGQLKKEACHGRIRRRLSVTELAVLESVKPASLAHNVWDAVGIGLFHLGRFERVRVIPA